MDKDDGVLLLFTAHRSKMLHIQLIHQYSAFASTAVLIFTSNVEDVPLVERFRSFIGRWRGAYRYGREESD